MDSMAQQWDELARLNARYSIISTPEFEAGEASSLEAFWASGREELDRILAMVTLGDTSTRTAVEIGCGIGRMTHALAARFARVVALDVSPEMIHRARDLGAGLANVEFVVGSGSDLSGVPDASADFVLAWFVLQHIPRTRDALRYVSEAGRVLRAGGTAFLHMRTSRDGVDHVRRWLERKLFYLLPLRLRLALGARGAVSREREFAARFRVWRGSPVRPRSVERVARAAGLAVVSAEPAGEDFTVFRLTKRAAAARA
jgi:SAM-dependent methyltransferase